MEARIGRIVPEEIHGFRTPSEPVALIPLHVRISSGLWTFGTRSSRSITVLPSTVLLARETNTLANRESLRFASALATVALAGKPRTV
ncbi:hypothetical protein PHBOTO_005534 [Pseudozyma hubeiensis]|nr:hypothetical protein PHBOTO_005534 [Pseudozyma hubeiensis]